jgi:hypothetical protein
MLVPVQPTVLLAGDAQRRLATPALPADAQLPAAIADVSMMLAVKGVLGLAGYGVAAE